ncbi:MAG: sensor histidine kinase [Opitutaceae bacterium]
MSTQTEEQLKGIIYDLEQRLEIALHCANQVWWEWDLPTGILKTHAIKDCILGYDLGKIRHHLDFWMDALPEEEREPVWQSLQEHLSGQTEMWSMEHQYRNPQGEYKWVLEAGKVITRNPDGSPLRMVGITQNIHEKKMLEQERELKNEQLTAALKLKDVVLAGASHDMLNVLNGGYGFAQLLKEESIGQTDDFRQIEVSLSQSISLISSIHELAKGNLVEILKDEIDPITIINESWNFHVPMAERQQLELLVNAKKGNSIITDGLALRRVLDNLVGNALKFTSSGYVSIDDLSTINELIIEVSDSGCGIAPEQEHLLFTPFKKLSSNAEGSGLGLSICQDLVNRLSGTLTYRPNTPSGSTFRLAIPREGDNRDPIEWS